ncbi:MAG: phosphatase PAP2 family protein [Bacteroidaceae bacterium]|nr:phosphatase PAP2 family protein [Bacteroidaceae bacterium]
MLTTRIEERVSKVVSWVFNPFSIPFLAFLILLLFSYLRMLPITYKLIILGIVYTFTILTPSLAIYVYCRLNRLSMKDLTKRHHRYAPFLLTILSYVCCLLLMRKMNIPWYMSGIILAALLMQVICICLNLVWKLSEHMAGAGAIVGGLVAFSALYGYNPIWWLCLFILIAGILGSARISLGHHTVDEVIGGFAIGLLCTLLVLHPSFGMPFSSLLF